MGTAAALVAAIMLGAGDANPGMVVKHSFETCESMGKVAEGSLTACFTRIEISEFWEAQRTDIDSAGEAAIAKPDLDTAIAEFDRAIAANANDASAYVGRGIALMLRKDLNRAIDDFDKAILLDPKNTAGFLDRGNAYFAKGENQRAIEDYNAAIRLNPEDPFPFNARGTVYSAEEKIELADADFAAAIAINPNIALFYFNHSRTESSLKRPERAMDDLASVQKLDPTFQELDKLTFSSDLRLLAQSFDCKTQYNQAIAGFDWVVALNPGDGMYVEDRARCHSAHGDDNLAVADYDTIIARGGSAQYFVERAEAEARLGQSDKALDDYANAIAHKDQLMGFVASEPYFNRGVIYLGRNNYALAIADFDNAIDVSPDNEKAFLARGRAYAATGDSRHAAKDFDEALRLVPTDAEAFLARGNFEEARRDHQAAISDYDRAATLASTDVRVFNNRCFARAASNTGLDLGLEDCGQALRLKPDDAGALSNRGLILLRLGRFGDAIASYDAALAANPHASWALFGRGLAKLRMGDASGTADLSAAKAADANVAAAFAQMGLSPG